VSAQPWIGCFRFHGLLAVAGAADVGRLPAPAGEGADRPLADVGRLPAPAGEGADRPPAIVLHAGAVWDADRAARGQGVRPGQDAAAARTACPEAAPRRFDRAAAAPLLAVAWDLLATASSVVEPDPDGRPEAYAAWRDGPPPLPEVRALQAAVLRALPHVDLAVGLGRSRLVARAVRPAAGPGLASAEPGAEADLLGLRPLALLVEEGLLAPALCVRLRDLGIRRCGQLAALPSGAVQGRFGREGLRARALCLGEDARPVLALHPPRCCLARRAWPGGLPPEAWTAAAAELGRSAAARLAAVEGARRLRLCGDFGERVRTWPAPRRDAGLLGRAAGEVAARAARQARAATGFLEVRLEEVAAIAIRPVSLLPARDARARRPDAVGDLLERLPRGLLRQGAGMPDRHERMVALLDPWREVRRKDSFAALGGSGSRLRRDNGGEPQP
jgi:protein ImuB